MAVISLALTDQLPDVVAKQNSNNNFLKSYPDNISSQLRSYAIFPVGHTEPCLKSTAPVKTLFMQGQLISRTTYADLWAYANASGNIVSEAVWTATNKGSFSVGDGSTTFRLPDTRDQFFRGASSTRILGTAQQDAMQGHVHVKANGYAPAGATYGDSSYWAQINAGSFAGVSNTGSPVTDGTNGTPRTAAETRPVNIVVNYLIVY